MKMDLSIVVILFASFLSTAISHPKNSDIIPKDYYKRQILQPIPGYIPVYIQTDAEPVVRRENVKQATAAAAAAANLQSDKTSAGQEKIEIKKSDEKISPDKLQNRNKMEESLSKLELTKGKAKSKTFHSSIIN